MKAPRKNNKTVSDSEEKHKKTRKAPGPPKTKNKGGEDSFPIVGIGASAGGLEAFEQFFTNMPPDNGMAFILIQHLDPSHKSILTDLIRRYTSMKVSQIEDGMKVEPDSVFVIPPNRYLAILHGKLHLMDSPASGIRAPIDFFFRSLAEDQKEKSICIILSGTGTEGTLGLRAIKGEGGMVMVQSSESAKYDGMPRSAISTGLVDYTLPADKMPEQLIDYVQHEFGRMPPKSSKPLLTEDLLDKVFLAVRSQTGHDFSYYKHSTIIRRVERRMAINRIGTLAEYVRHLQSYPEESTILFREILIGVTNFFRDPEALDSLQQNVIVQLLEKKRRDEPLRIWTPGCATGEEAYSLAILFQNQALKHTKDINVQIFATDIDDRAIETARSGCYPGSIAADIRPEFLARHFIKEESGSYRVKKNIRDMVVFAVQNVISDPPFSKIDLITCRNLLIYLGPELQKKVLSLFYYALNQDGFLFLGSSETVNETLKLFHAIDRKWKIYKRKDSQLAMKEKVHLPSYTHREPTRKDSDSEQRCGKITYRETAEKIILDNYSPSGIIINEQNEILYVHGRTGKYLEHVSGEFSGDIVGMCREGLKFELAAAIRKARTEDKEVRRENLHVKTNGDEQLVTVIVKPIEEPASVKGSMIVIFEDVSSQVFNEVHASDAVSPDAYKQMEQELRSTKEYLEATTEEFQTSTEELRSTNEQLQSANEELQSANEELETSKEELQSVNEELITVNSELEQKINELSRTGNDMQNLLTSTEIGTIFLDTHLNILRFTPATTRFIKLIPTDIGRPVSDLVANFYYEGLVRDAQEVLKTLAQKEVEVQTKEARWYTMRLLPYRTVENVIDGVVITFMDITELKRMEKKIDDALQFSESIVNTVRESLVVLDADMRVVSANRSFFRTFEIKAEDTEGKLFYTLDGGQWDIPELRNLLEEILPEKTEMDDFKVEHEFERIGKRTMLLNARKLESETGSRRVLLAIEDITGSEMC
jgi:two-component system CheB/CheR fusion protein